ncbi:MOSC domain-containing protein [Vibrio cholerae]
MSAPDSSQQPQLSQINVYPVKSVGGIALSTSWVEKQGLTFDRRFMLATADGQMVTARKFPQMITVRSSLTADGLVITAEGHAPLRLRYDAFKMQAASAQVWNDRFTAYTTTDEADDWFSAVIGQRVELLYTGEQSNRVREKLGHNVSFADGYPLLIISQASLDELNRRSPERHDMEQFRTNLVAGNTAPFEEDRWKRIRIGDVEFEAVKPCERCVLTTVEVEKGAFRRSKEPLQTLSQFRANERGGVFFGQNLVAKNEGLIRQGDEIEVLEYKEPEFYADKGQPSLSAVEAPVQDSVKSLTISVNGNIFSGDNQRTLLEQAEDAGIPMANSCRAGLCGACRVTVESGEVDQEDVPALHGFAHEPGLALACCCVPKSDIEVIS